MIPFKENAEDMDYIWWELISYLWEKTICLHITHFTLFAFWVRGERSDFTLFVDFTEEASSWVRGAVGCGILGDPR